ncbi:hypothetical protein CLAFUW4_13355 [Fulvia fulva]|uniref:Uncharacterized protein n=1 Tax=Passalora fulva TaxID=5499 RepID=A0A9Q8UVH4_PASFU|nr:uncharacterized protein CLAFUR5_13210 [Fulvia fulva]KAK4611714.1 hypothetical protein CLAFUR4_13359 [Fulvia fulva]KAK4612583.1 hypothetical protein CLAFUR0_13365 [Fulvia fulva]UJO23994.1 hypothetical protein CLAFUR5_13210 [Fulvia fulva]WPV20970.1 hypothetical protein CLAFUW4_13355 [Fulvia fulva]WPV36354.1 hypothetical protein CLAFUW7_13362 [Fulvia fulva]
MVTTRRMLRADVQDPKKQPFPLLVLPPEIWCEIGKLVVDAGPFLRLRDIDNLSPLAKLGRPATWHQPPITRVCTALRHELLSYYYNTKVRTSHGQGLRLRNRTFWASDANSIYKWLHAIGRENRKDVRGLLLYRWSEEKRPSAQELAQSWKLHIELGEEGTARFGWRVHPVKFLQ